MTEAIVYNLRSSSLGYAITKWVDGNPEGSYHTSYAECTCPAGSRPTCRHRQMLPQMLERNLLDSPLFWNFDLKHSCDIEGNAKRETVALPKGPQIASEPLPVGIQVFNLAETSPAELFNAIAEAVGEPTIPTKPQPFRRRL